MANLNKVMLIGRLTRDPELRALPSGTPVTEFALATNREYKDQNGQKKETTCFVELVVFGRRAEVVNEYLKKGSQVFVEGRLDFETWESKSGEKRSRHRVFVENFQFLGGGAGAGRSGGSEYQASPSPESQPAVREPSRPADAEKYDLGDLPF